MSKVLVFQHVAYEILGTLNPLLKQHGFRIRYVNFDRTPEEQPTIDGYDGLVILGGPMNTDQSDRFPHLDCEVRVIREAIEQDIPVLGICLGAQLVAKALGARIDRNPEWEIGWYDILPTEEGRKDPLLRNFSDTEKIFMWHGDTFEIPKGAVHLATSQTCVNQAFRYGDRTYGFQFHMEVDEPMVGRWLAAPDRQRELRCLKGRVGAEEVRGATRAHIDSLTSLSAQTFTAFIDLFGNKKKFRALPSR